MLSNELMIDAFERIKAVVHKTVEDLSLDDLAFRPSDSANSIAWLVWHLSRIQDDHIAGLAGQDQVWAKDWVKKFDLPFEPLATGYGQGPKEVAAVRVKPELLLGYYDAVHSVTVSYLKALDKEDYRRVVDKRWDPPVTLAVRIVSVISDNLQHAGQAAFVKGLLK
jgi:Protein of unknown function (DUF664)